MLITEPTTTLTDYAIAGVAFILAGFLLRSSWQNQQISVCLWAGAFGFVAIAAALGGTCHGFVWLIDAAWSNLLWHSMLYALSFVSFLMLIGTIFSRIVKRWQRLFLLGAFTKSALAWMSLMQIPQFSVAAADYVSAMVLVLILQAFAVKRADCSAYWLVAGILVSGLAIGILASGFSVSASLNHNDLYHLVQLVGLGLLYQGAKQLTDR